MSYISRCGNTIITIALFLSISPTVFPQLDKTDPFKDNYILGNSAEIFVVRTAEDTVELKIVDAVGNINSGGLTEKPSSLELGEWSTLEYQSPVSLISGDFNDDKYTDVVAAWQGKDSSVILYMPEIDPVSLSITGAYKAHLAETGLPEMVPATGD